MEFTRSSPRLGRWEYYQSYKMTPRLCKSPTQDPSGPPAVSRYNIREAFQDFGVKKKVVNYNKQWVAGSENTNVLFYFESLPN